MVLLGQNARSPRSTNPDEVSAALIHMMWTLPFWKDETAQSIDDCLSLKTGVFRWVGIKTSDVVQLKSNRH